MTALLFFDDNALSIRENVIRGVGMPTLIPESVWYDDDRLNTHWGYPGVFFDAADAVWRMVYQARIVDSNAPDRLVKLVAESDDGLDWHGRDTRATVTVPNRQFRHQVADSGSEWCGLYIDAHAPPDTRIKKLGERKVWASPDGIHWKQIGDWRSSKVDAPMIAVWNSLYNKHFVYGRPAEGDRRWTVRQTEDWRAFTDPALLLQSDGQDEPLTDLYGMPVLAYEGWYIGLLWLYHGAAPAAGEWPYRFTGGKVDCQLAYSLNGIGWQRTRRDTFIGCGEPGTPTGGCVYPLTVVKRPETDALWIYASASATEHGLTPRRGGSIVAYRLRRDGFVYLESRSGVGRIATKPICWQGGELRLNVQGQGDYTPRLPSGDQTPYQRFMTQGGIRVQINDPRGRPIEGYTFDECTRFAGDSVDWCPTWAGSRTLDTLRGTAIQVAIQLNNARLYAVRGDFQSLCPRELLTIEETGRCSIARGRSL